MLSTNPKGPKYLYGTKYGFCSSNFPHGLGKYSPYGYSGPFGEEVKAMLGRRFAPEAPAALFYAVHGWDLNWVAVKELKLSYYIGETLLFTIYTHYGNLN